MKKLTILIFLISNFSWGQDSTSVKIIARSLPDKVLVRWALDQPLEWKKANEFGFWVERATIFRDGQTVLPMERELLTSTPLKPKPLEEWETLAKKDQNAAILAQALYGESFETTAPGSQMGSIFAVNDELEQRFTFALLAAEQNYEAAKLAGWAYEDTAVRKGEKYVYIVKVALPDDSTLAIRKGTVYAGPDFYEPLPKPIGFTGAFGDGHATLNWNYNLLQSLYSSYIVERSSDSINFERLNGSPIFNAQQSENNQQSSLYYTDSIPNNTNFWYRIKGKSAFGEEGPASGTLTGTAIEALGYVPRIYHKEIPTDTSAKLFWEFDKKGNNLINSFQLRRSNTNNGTYETVKKDIPVTQRQISYQGLKRSNYFTIVAMGKNGIESESFPTLVQPMDSIPPKPPVGLIGIMDTTGLVRLNWNKNLEEDLNGYRIYKSNNPNVEFSEVTNATLLKDSYTDTVPAANLNKKIYYKILAEDQRYNKSTFSKILIVDKPDMIAPSPPVLRKYEVTEQGIRINWIPSSSADVISHIVYRRNAAENDVQWEKLFDSSAKDTTFLDEKELERNIYSYTVVAIDSSGYESQPANPVTVTWNGRILIDKDIKFSGSANRELRFINLSWKIKNDDILEYRLYRGNQLNGLKLYKTFDASAKNFNDVDLEINSDYTYGIQMLLSGGRTSFIKKINVKY